MALFTTKKNTKKTTSKTAPVAMSAKKESGGASVGYVRVLDVLRSPRITEKATDEAEKRNAYVFNVNPSANKIEVKEAIKRLYSVTPVKVRIVSIPGKLRTRKGITGKSAEGKKAYVYLKKGETIESF